MHPFIDHPISILGTTSFRGTHRPFGITQEDRLGHMWILGKTGTGKSTLLTHLIVQDLEAHRGYMVLDPHGDLVEAVLDLVPANRVAETIYFNPADLTMQIGRAHV